MVIPCACGLFLYALRNTNKHFWRRCRGMIAVFSLNLVRPCIYIFSFCIKTQKNTFTMKPTPNPTLSASKGEFTKRPSKPKILSGYELCPSLIVMVRAQPLSRFEHENPCNHLLEFKEMCSCLSILGMA